MKGGGSASSLRRWRNGAGPLLWKNKDDGRHDVHHVIGRPFLPPIIPSLLPYAPPFREARSDERNLQQIELKVQIHSKRLAFMARSSTVVWWKTRVVKSGCINLLFLQKTQQFLLWQMV